MINSLGEPQSVLLLGGTSDIALATMRAWAETCKPHVTMAARPGSSRSTAADELRSLGLVVDEVDFEAGDTGSHPGLIEAIAANQDIDVALVAFGILGDEEQAWQDHASAVQHAQVNYVAAISVGVVLGQVLRAQGHGVIVALSSVAGERVRRSNFVYGSTKAGMDSFFLGLGEALRGSGARVLVVRPGFVHTKMTEGREPAPLSVTADQVGEAIVQGVARRQDLIWVPRAFRPVMSGLRHIPRAAFRHLPL